MIPIDKSGYGKAQYWEKTAKDIADEHDESCEHLCNYLPKVTFKYDSKINDDFYMRFRVRCTKCKQRFYTTEIVLRTRFIEFYGLESLADKKKLADK